MDSSKNNDAGFFTPMFGGMAIAIALVALAYTQIVRSQELASRGEWDRLRQDYAAAGVMNLAAWTVMHQVGTPTVSWDEATNVGPMRVTVEPEMRKLALSEISGTRAFERLKRIMPGSDAMDVVRKMQALSSAGGRPPTRDALRQVSDLPAWRDCGLTVVSPYSRLTDNALAPVSRRLDGKPSLRAGEVWRISVVRDKRVLLDWVVRFTGDPKAPIAVIDQLVGEGLSSPEACAARIAGPVEQSS